MRRKKYLSAVSVLIVASALADAAEFKPVIEEVLLNPDPADWLMINRTYDEQRFSPLGQINRNNVGNLQLAWTRGLPQGTQESTPIVHQGVMYVIAPGGGVEAIDGTNGDLIWEYWRIYPKDMAQAIAAPSLSRSKNLAIFEDMVYFAAPDGFLVALDAKSGAVRWQTRAHDCKDGTEHTGGLMVADGKLLSNRTCKVRAGCFIAAHDAKTGQELWKFYNTSAPGEPGGDSWGNLPGGAALGIIVGAARVIRSQAQSYLLGDCQSDSLHAAKAARARRCGARRSALRTLQQLDGRSRRHDRQADLVLPALAG
jgi:alcohol dehydrogenase (cytochrome c)